MILPLHEYEQMNKLEMREITANHFVYCSEKEYKAIKSKILKLKKRSHF